MSIPFLNDRLTVETFTSTTEDDYGDPVKTWTTAWTEVPAMVQEKTHRVWDPTEGRALTVRTHEALVPGSVPIGKGDRVTTRDERKFHVTHSELPSGVAFPGAARRLELDELGA